MLRGRKTGGRRCERETEMDDRDAGVQRRAEHAVASTIERGDPRRSAEAGRSAPAADPAQTKAELAAALRIERRRAVKGHWTYDLSRHIALLQAYRAAMAE